MKDIFGNDTQRLCARLIIRFGITLFVIGWLPLPVHAKVLNVRLVEQEQSNWCWAGSNEMVFRYYGTAVDQCAMANYAAARNDFPVSDCCASPSECNETNLMGDYPGSMQDILQHWGIESDMLFAALKEATIKNEIDQRRPFIMGWYWNSGGGHALVGRGIEGRNVYYIDPWPGEGYKISTYNYVLKSSIHQWEESLQITTPFNRKHMPWIAPLLLKSNRLDAQVEVKLLDYHVIDAEYSKQLDKIITVSSSPNQLHIYDPETEGNIAIDLPVTASCVSVSPDGHYAAVGHDAWISYVNLVQSNIEKTIPVTTDVSDIVLAGNGYVYAFPRGYLWDRIRCVEIESGVETQSTGNYILAGTLARLHPNGSAIYGADNGVTPSDIEKYSIVNGVADYYDDSPYHGDYAMCGNLWISEDGLRIFTKCGSVFRSSDTPSIDMTYTGSLSELERIESLSDSLAAKKVVAIPGFYWATSEDIDTRIQIYDRESLAFDKSIRLPPFRLNGKYASWHGRYVFFNRDGSSYYVIVTTDTDSELPYYFGVATYPQ